MLAEELVKRWRGCSQKWEEKYKSDVLETRVKAISGRGELVVWSAVGRNY